MGSHLIEGEFQSDKYPATPRGCVPLKPSDPTAQDLLWLYAQRRRTIDPEFAADLEEALRLKGYDPAKILDERERIARLSPEEAHQLGSELLEEHERTEPFDLNRSISEHEILANACSEYIRAFDPNWSGGYMPDWFKRRTGDLWNGMELGDCPECGNSGFSGPGTGYVDVCSHCGGQSATVGGMPIAVGGVARRTKR